MPKLSIDFPAQLSLQVTDEMHDQLIAIGYLTGNGGEYASPARNFLRRAIQEYIDGLPPRERKDYEAILSSVTLAERTKRAMKTERLKQKTPV